MGDSHPDAHRNGLVGENCTALVSNNIFATAKALSFVSMFQNYFFYCQDVPFAFRDPRGSEPVDLVEEVWKEMEEILRKTEKTSEVSDSSPIREVVTNDKEGFWADLMQRCLLLEAGGGLIFSENKMLWILRHGRWDLPKGKAEPGESMLETAIRECIEECGLVGLAPLDPNNNLETNHLYLFKGHVAWKRSHWFTMTCPMQQNLQLQPQTEEGITEVRWMLPEEVRSVALPWTYPSVQRLIRMLDPPSLKGFGRI
ncbi:MAG: NUDIX domain-containing protein [Cytophagia bacterium]|nr:NUDIX domain-containing protein [Cytophagia bacterium]